MNIKILLCFLISCYKVCGQSVESNLNLSQLRAQNVQPTTADNKKYTLSLTLPNSELSETRYFEPSNGKLTVKGSINTYYPDTMVNLRVNYVADKNGYSASYQIVKSFPVTGAKFETRLSSSALKSLAG